MSRLEEDSKLLVFLIDPLVEATYFALESLHLFIGLVESLMGVDYFWGRRF